MSGLTVSLFGCFLCFVILTFLSIDEIEKNKNIEIEYNKIICDIAKKDARYKEYINYCDKIEGF